MLRGYCQRTRANSCDRAHRWTEISFKITSDSPKLLSFVCMQNPPFSPSVTTNMEIIIKWSPSIPLWGSGSGSLLDVCLSSTGPFPQEHHTRSYHQQGYQTILCIQCNTALSKEVLYLGGMDRWHSFGTDDEVLYGNILRDNSELPEWTYFQDTCLSITLALAIFNKIAMLACPKTWIMNRLFLAPQLRRWIFCFSSENVFISINSCYLSPVF